MRRHLLLATLTAAALVACGPAPTPAPSAEPEQRRKATNPGPAATKRPDGADAYGANFKRNLPDRVTVALVESKETSETGADAPKVTFSYTPNPPDVQVELAPAAGTSSFEIAAVEVTWIFNEPGKAEATKLGPTKLPIAPVKVTGAPNDQEGPAFRVPVPLGVRILEPYFTAEAGKRITQASAELRFLDPNGNAIFRGGSATALRVPIPVSLL